MTGTLEAGDIATILQLAPRRRRDWHAAGYALRARAGCDNRRGAVTGWRRSEGYVERLGAVLRRPS